MKVQYGNIAARCNRCASQHFKLVSPSTPLTAHSVLTCLRCDGTALHGHLITQIGDEACRQASLARVNLQAERNVHRVRLEALRRH